jgi:hypothetical protein
MDVTIPRQQPHLHPSPPRRARARAYNIYDQPRILSRLSSKTQLPSRLHSSISQLTTTTPALQPRYTSHTRLTYYPVTYPSHATIRAIAQAAASPNPAVTRAGGAPAATKQHFAQSAPRARFNHLIGIPPAGTRASHPSIATTRIPRVKRRDDVMSVASQSSQTNGSIAVGYQ